MADNSITKEYSIHIYPKTKNFNTIKAVLTFSKFLLEREEYIIDFRRALSECGFEHISNSLSDMYYRGSDSAVALFWLTYTSPLLDYMEIHFDSFLRIHIEK